MRTRFAGVLCRPMPERRNENATTTRVKLGPMMSRPGRRRSRALGSLQNQSLNDDLPHAAVRADGSPLVQVLAQVVEAGRALKLRQRQRPDEGEHVARDLARQLVGVRQGGAVEDD